MAQQKQNEKVISGAWARELRKALDAELAIDECTNKYMRRLSPRHVIEVWAGATKRVIYTAAIDTGVAEKDLEIGLFNRLQQLSQSERSFEGEVTGHDKTQTDQNQ